MAALMHRRTPFLSSSNSNNPAWKPESENQKHYEGLDNEKQSKMRQQYHNIFRRLLLSPRLWLLAFLLVAFIFVVTKPGTGNRTLMKNRRKIHSHEASLPIRRNNISSAIPWEMQSHLIDVDNSKDFNGYHDDRVQVTPFFWHIPKAGGTSIKLGSSLCLRLIQASESGAIIAKKQGLGRVTVDGVQLLMHQESVGKQPFYYINIDTSTIRGLREAHQMQFESNGMAQIITSPLLTEAADLLFDEWHQGLLFTILRHPVERAVSTFYYLREAKWEPTYHPDWANMTLLEYGKSGMIESNWVVKSLLGKRGELTGPISMDDLEQAKQILKTKCYIGIMEDMERTLHRFGSYLGWDKNDRWKHCFGEMLDHAKNAHVHPKIERGSAEWKAIEDQNRLDIALYNYALELFHQQSDT